MRTSSSMKSFSHMYLAFCAMARSGNRSPRRMQTVAGGISRVNGSGSEKTRRCDAIPCVLHAADGTRARATERRILSRVGRSSRCARRLGRFRANRFDVGGRRAARRGCGGGGVCGEVAVPEKIAVLGDGAWGTAVALLLAQKPHHRVCLWSAFEANHRQLIEKRENVRLLPGVPIPPTVDLTLDPAAALAGCGLAVSAIPTVYLRN